MNNSSLTCWYIEDDIVDVECFERIVSSFERKIAYSIIEGVSQLQEKIDQAHESENYPDIVLSDIHLQDGDGFTCLRLVQDSFDVTPQCIVFSTSDHPSDYAKAEAIGVNRYIVKPNTFAETAQYIRDIFSYTID
jgi:DNA-binding NarL/FixJ family response regulator